VRETICDGLADGFRTIAVKEAIGDRVPGAVLWNLFDIDAKFGDVETTERCLQYLEAEGGRAAAEEGCAPAQPVPSLGQPASAGCLRFPSWNALGAQTMSDHTPNSSMRRRLLQAAGGHCRAGCAAPPGLGAVGRRLTVTNWVATGNDRTVRFIEAPLVESKGIKIVRAL
jgi:hypothetical protein